ncbi:MAG: nicotinate-nucleotide adenylyltransferase [Candidatus Zixiibacteriota bacterium]
MFRTKLEKAGNWGIMGGVFDPIHYAHLLLAESAAAAFGLRGVLFIVSFNPPHRDQKPVAPFPVRLKMVSEAIKDNDRFVISDMEQDLDMPSYTVNIVDILHQTYPEIDWHLILGSDNIAAFNTWYKPEELVKKARIVVAGRPGYEESMRHSPWLDKVQKFEMPLMDISSTMIRRRIGEGHSIRYLVPEGVRRIIEKEGLYK